MTDPRREDPVLITDAQMSYEEELEVRKRRYRWTMGLRFPCIILAGLFYQIPWLAVTLLVISVPLPWIAVLIANDRLPRKAEKPNRYRHGNRELENRPHDVIDSSRSARSDRSDDERADATADSGAAANTGSTGDSGAATDARAAANTGAAGDSGAAADARAATGTSGQDPEGATGVSGQDPAGASVHRDTPASG